VAIGKRIAHGIVHFTRVSCRVFTTRQCSVSSRRLVFTREERTENVCLHNLCVDFAASAWKAWVMKTMMP